MRNYIVLIILCLFIAPNYAQSSSDLQDWKYFDDMMIARQNPIIVKTHNDSCYLEQHLFQDGNIYIEVPVINGKRNGIYKEYYPNGQLFQCYEMKDGCRVDSTTEITYDKDGDIKYILIYIKFQGKIFSCRTDYIFKKKYVMLFHEMPQKKMVAEYKFEDGKWRKRPYHVKPVRYANRLFHIYRKEWKKKFPNIEF